MWLSNIQPCAYLGLLVIGLDLLKSGHSWAVNNFASQVEQQMEMGHGSGPNDPTIGLLYPRTQLSFYLVGVLPIPLWVRSDLFVIISVGILADVQGHATPSFPGWGATWMYIPLS